MLRVRNDAHPALEPGTTPSLCHGSIKVVSSLALHLSLAVLPDNDDLYTMLVRGVARI